MPRIVSEPLTPAEWKVMKIVWRRKQCAARDVYEETLGLRMGSFDRQVRPPPAGRQGVPNDHSGRKLLCLPACLLGNASSLGAADALLETVLDGTTGVVLTHLVKNSRLSAEELADLRALLETQTPKES